MAHEDHKENETPKNESLVILRTVSLIVCVAAAAGSFGLMLLARQRAPYLIAALFTVWVLAPFVALLLAHIFSKGWAALTQVTLYSVILFVTIVSLAIYGYQLIWPRQSTPAFFWVATPPASILFSIATVAIAALISRRR